MLQFKAPYNLAKIDYRKLTLFLGGSIDQGKAEDWQKLVVRALTKEQVTILNPRRDNWDPNWEQSIDNPEFREQVQWELMGMDWSDVIFMHLAAGSKAPISLLESGLHATSGKLLVSCSPQFYRRGNVEILCCHHRIPLFTDLQRAIVALRNQIHQLERSGVQARILKP